LVLRACQLSKHLQDLEKAAEALRKARFSSKEQFEKRFDHKLSKEKHKAGDLVLVWNTAIEMSHDWKHKPRYLGPYIISEVTKGENYKLCQLDGSPLQNMYAAFRVVPYITQNHPFMGDNANMGPELDSTGTDTKDAEMDDPDNLSN